MTLYCIVLFIILWKEDYLLYCFVYNICRRRLLEIKNLSMTFKCLYMYQKTLAMKKSFLP